MRIIPSWPIPTIALGILLGATSAQAQYTVPSAPSPAVGETYHVEIGGDFWNPSPLVLVTSESLGIPGTEIDLVRDFGVQKRRFRQFNVILRPARKHKFRLDYTPISYEADAVVERRIVFNGIAYDIGLPVSMAFQWKAWHFGYEYDFLYKDRGFVGLILQAKYTDVRVSLDAAFGQEYARARAPIPAIGGIGRIYVTSNAALTFEVSGIGLPATIDEDIKAKYVEYNFYGTVNFNNYVGFKLGYRTFDVDYTFDLDKGDFQLKGWYFGGVARF